MVRDQFVHTRESGERNSTLLLMKFKAPQAVQYLKSHWKHLDALTKGDLVSKLTNGGVGVSRRALARVVGCSESSLRYLEKASKLSDAAKADIQAKKISVRSAVGQSHVIHPVPSPQHVVTVGTVEEATIAWVPEPQFQYVTQTPSDAKGWAELMVQFTLKEYRPQRDACVEVIRGARLLCRKMPWLRLGTRSISFGASTSYLFKIHGRCAGWMLSMTSHGGLRLGLCD
jgi:hypothetical protein